MDRIVAPSNSRVDSRNHRHVQYTLTEKELGRESDRYEQEKVHADEPLLIREHKRRTVMGNSHRRFHRRASQASARTLTVNVEVVATLDTAGNVVAQATITQLDSSAPAETTQALPVTNAIGVSAPPAVAPSSAPIVAAAAASAPEVPSVASLSSETRSAVPSTPSERSQASAPSASAEPTAATVVALPSVPSVPAVPSVSFPSVPAVPPFPSTLTVPAYPYASSTPSKMAANAVSITSASSASTDASSSPTLVAALTATTSTNSTISGISSSTSSIASSVLVPSPTLLSTMSGFMFSSSSGAATWQSAISSGVSTSGVSTSGSSWSGASLSTSAPSYSATPTESLDAAGSASFYGSGGPGWNGGTETAAAGAPTGSTAAISGDEADGTEPLDTPQVVGSVVGSLAGAALILAIILILLRRHKRRQNGGALQLADDRRPHQEQAMRQVQAPAPARASLVPSAFLNRFSGLSRSTAETSSPTERSFQRVSGRKLPSAFSEGMTSDQFSRGGTMSGSSFYQDEHGTYGGPGALNKEYGGDLGKEIGGAAFAGGAGTMNLRPSPARTPVIRHPDANPFNDTNRPTLSPPMSPNPFSSPNIDLSPRAALGRSLHSADGSRSSRFTENV
ncbi:uncharacterized protein EKO05_0003298 [Ascochyta rabiei]|uniref:Uncharacterized protein n=1 Tax=Didymella rabiei TaxID=5454 RepID=A0A163E1K4_DIDRA|nr:uncharacterized protein EKO05_0003298 [Ascochyta rabiei]KZM23460.1 hypothetical protein ST47_g5397 [Ascochyta rabiei]UPX12760.1 hypothetical protein EKO05_0003298 [Ascochyta rabiei]